MPPVQQHTTDLIVALLQYFIFLLIPKPTSPRATSVTAAVAAAVATAAAAAALAARDVSFSAQFLLLHPNPFNPHGAGARLQARSNLATATALHSCAVKCAAVNKMRPLDFAKAAASAAKAMVSAELCRTLLEEMGKDAAQLPTLSLQHLQR